MFNEAFRTGYGLTMALAVFRVNKPIRQLLKNLKLQNAIPETIETWIGNLEE